MNSVDGKVAFITGGARGIGAAVARRLHAKGAKVVLTDLDEAALRALAEDLGSEHAHAVVADVRDLASMEAAATQGIERFGGIDIVVANAGIGIYGSVLKVDPEAFRILIDVNLIGVFHTVRAALPAVTERRGYLLIVSSAAAYLPTAGMAAYDASKAGIEHFASALRQEVTHLGVDVGSAHMGWIDTPLMREGTEELSTAREFFSSLPGPLKKPTSVQACADVFVNGIEGRRRRVNCPSWIGVFRWLKPLLTTSFGESQLARWVPDLLPRMDAEVAALGRSMSARTEALEKQSAR